ncbi:hypothetical protein PMIN06_012921 [Paraphaeosphaeria minitans]
MRCKAWLLPVTLLQRILAFGVDMDPLSNLRPNNITGLNYYLYRWTGSYAALSKILPSVLITRQVLQWHYDDSCAAAEYLPAERV